MKKKIKIKFVDFNVGLGFNKKKNDFIDILKERYEVEQCDNPDYIFYSVFGSEHLKYNCIRIFYTAECYTPDFNECDYAMGYDRLSFADRYLRLPLYRILRYGKSYKEICTTRHFTMRDVEKKTGFCNFVYSNCFAQSKRSEIFDALNKYRRVESGGCYRNNVGGPVLNKREFQEKTKFSIAFENTSYSGYSTEKLVEAIAAGTVPIYYGDPQIAEDFNEEAFVNVHRYKSIEDVVERVKEIDNNNDLYLQILNAVPVLHPKDDSDLKDFLYHIFDQKLENAFRRPKSLTSLATEHFKLRHRFSEKYVYKYINKLRNTIFRLKTGTLLRGKPTIT